MHGSPADIQVPVPGRSKSSALVQKITRARQTTRKDAFVEITWDVATTIVKKLQPCISAYLDRPSPPKMGDIPVLFLDTGRNHGCPGIPKNKTS